jgi:hypothetical protein
MTTHRFAILGLALTITSLTTFPARANEGGVSGMSASGCAPCHGDAAAGVEIAVNGPQSVAPGSSNAYVVTLSGSPTQGGGLNVAASSGFLVAGTGCKLVGAELTHVSGGARTWSFSWTAPSATGPALIWVAAIAVNGSGDAEGDAWALQTVPITVAGAPPLDTDGDTTPDSSDCAPSNPAVHPLAAENCVNGIDDNCNALVDEADPGCGAVAPSHVLGDLAPRGAPDERISVADVVVALRLAVQLDTPTADEMVTGDVAPGAVTEPWTTPPVFTASPNGSIDVGDAVVILRAAVGLIRINPALPFQGHGNLIALHANAWLQPQDACRTCHGSMMSQGVSTPGTPAFHPRHLPLLPSYTCTSCHRSVDLLEKSGGNLRKQVDVQTCVPCHAPGGPGTAAGVQLYLD